jgi:hypothetical protein
VCKGEKGVAQACLSQCITQPGTVPTGQADAQAQTAGIHTVHTQAYGHSQSRRCIVDEHGRDEDNGSDIDAAGERVGGAAGACGGGGERGRVTGTRRTSWYANPLFSSLCAAASWLTPMLGVVLTLTVSGGGGQGRARVWLARWR